MDSVVSLIEGCVNWRYFKEPEFIDKTVNDKKPEFLAIKEVVGKRSFLARLEIIRGKYLNTDEKITYETAFNYICEFQKIEFGKLIKKIKGLKLSIEFPKLLEVQGDQLNITRGFLVNERIIEDLNLILFFHSAKTNTCAGPQCLRPVLGIRRFPGENVSTGSKHVQAKTVSELAEKVRGYIIDAEGYSRDRVEDNYDIQSDNVGLTRIPQEVKHFKKLREYNLIESSLWYYPDCLLRIRVPSLKCLKIFDDEETEQ